MNCSDVREELWAYVMGECGGQTKEALEQHIGSCAGCRRLCDENRSFYQDVDQTVRLRTSEESIKEGVKRAVTHGQAGSRRRVILIPLTAVSAAVLVFLGIYLLGTNASFERVLPNKGMIKASKESKVEQVGERKFRLESGELRILLNTLKGKPETQQLTVLVGLAALEIRAEDQDCYVDFTLESRDGRSVVVRVAAGVVQLAGGLTPLGTLKVSPGDSVRLSEERKRAVYSAYQGLLSYDAGTKRAAMKKLVELEAHMDLAFIGTAHRVGEIVALLKQFGFLKQVYETDPALIESLAWKDVKEWPVEIGRRLVLNYNFFTGEQRDALAGRVLNDKDIYLWLKQRESGEALASVEEAWFYREVLVNTKAPARDAAVWALWRVIEKLPAPMFEEITRDLLRHLDDEVQEVRAPAAYSLRIVMHRYEGKLLEEVADALISKLVKSDHHVRIQCVFALSAVAKQLSGALAESLGEAASKIIGDEDDRIRSSAALVMEHVSDKVSMKMLDHMIWTLERAWQKEQVETVRTSFRSATVNLMQKKIGRQKK